MCLLDFSEQRDFRLVTFGAYTFNCPLVGGAAVFVREGAALRTLEVIDEGPQGAPLLALLVGDLRSSPLHKGVEVGVVAAEIVNGIEKGATTIV
jgi:hypothetical protein